MIFSPLSLSAPPSPQPHLGLITTRPGTFKQICLQPWHELMVAEAFLLFLQKNRAHLEGKESSSAEVRTSTAHITNKMRSRKLPKQPRPLLCTSTKPLLLWLVAPELQTLQGRTQQPPVVCSLHVCEAASKISLKAVSLVSNSHEQRCVGLWESLGVHLHPAYVLAALPCQPAWLLAHDDGPMMENGVSWAGPLGVYSRNRLRVHERW